MGELLMLVWKRLWGSELMQLWRWKVTNFAQLNNLDDLSSSFIFGELDRWGQGCCHLKQEEQVSEKNCFIQIETEMLEIQDVEQSAGWCVRIIQRIVQKRIRLSRERQNWERHLAEKRSQIVSLVQLLVDKGRGELLLAWENTWAEKQCWESNHGVP